MVDIGVTFADDTLPGIDLLFLIFRGLISKLVIKKSNINLIFLEKNEHNQYRNIKNKIFIRSKLDKRRKKNKEKNTLNISSFTGEGVKVLLKNCVLSSQLTKKLEPSE